MKTKLITKLKKELLIIETHEETLISKTATGFMIRNNATNEDFFIEGSYTLLGSPDEIKDEDVKDLVEKITTRQYKNY